MPLPRQASSASSPQVRPDPNEKPPEDQRVSAPPITPSIGSARAVGDEYIDNDLSAYSGKRPPSTSGC